MIILAALIVTAWVTITVLGNQGYYLGDQSGSRQAQSWNSQELQPIAIPVKDDRRFSRN
ncbi:MAG: hypothetical protein LH702_20555 [Phormidesmis sp. CAN_BIN44]|nr:hypothetical protein [Phormidesmis sp. CAN_BIN44]